MAVGPFCGVTPFLFRKKSIGNQGKGRSDGNRNPFRSKKFRNMKAAMVRGSREGSGNSVTMAELKNKITIFRDLLDLPPSVGSVSVNELLIVTVKDIRKMYPNLKLGKPVLEGKDASMYKCLKFLCDTLKSLGDMWTLDKGLGRCKYDPSKKLGKRQLERIALKLLDEMIKLAKERFIELTDGEEEMRCYDHHASSPTKGESGSYSDGAKSSNPGSPVTPKSVLPGPQKSRGKCFSPSMPKSKSVQSIRKLSSVDFKRISFYMLPDAISVAQVHKHSAKMNIDSELERKKAEVVEQDYVKKVSRDDSMVDYMNLSNEVNGESEAKSDALKIRRSEYDVNMVSEEDGTVDNMEMSIEVNAEPEGKSDAFKIGGSDSVGKVSEEDVMVYYMEVSTEVTGEAEAKSDEGRNRISSHHVNPVTAPMASAKQDELSSNVTEETASKPTSDVSVLPLVTPQPQATVSMPNLTEQDQPMQLPVRTSPPPPPSPETSGNAVCAPLPPAAPPPLETSGNAVCAPSPQESATAQLPGTSGNAVCTPPTPPPLAVGCPAPPLPPPMTPTNGLAPPPPPPLMGGSNGPAPPPPMPNGSAPPPPPRANGGGGPPPPPGGGGASLRLKKAATKLKRSSQMGTLYRRLKGKVEGTSSDGKPSGGKMGKAGSAPAGGKQGMADALAEMTKKSAYFLQIQEDVKNYLGVVKELKITIGAFQTSDMAELVKFHRHVESHLEKLTDESQVLARCEDFPVKKLEALRMSASLYTKLDTIATTLRDWSVAGMTLKQNLDKAEGYFDKIKVDLDSLERTKDDELKRFQAQKIMFDFGILIRIKELMVDLSSNCMELTLKEKKEVDSKQNGQPNEGLKKLMWRSFQFAYRVYTFAGGQDERADRLTKELADVIENDF